MVPNHLAASQALEPDVLIAVGKLAIGGQLVMIETTVNCPQLSLAISRGYNAAAAADLIFGVQHAARQVALSSASPAIRNR